jgi:hypothetical protein
LYEDFANELTDEICDEITPYLPIRFMDGFCGIGWGILHLVEYGFIDSDVDGFLNDIDRCIMDRDVRRITDTDLYTGLGGIAHYAIQRKKMEGAFLMELLRQMESTVQQFGDSSIQRLDEYDYLKERLSRMVHPKDLTPSCSSGKLLQCMVNETTAETDTSDRLSYGLKGLSGIGLKLIMGNIEEVKETVPNGEIN